MEDIRGAETNKVKEVTEKTAGGRRSVDGRKADEGDGGIGFGEPVNVRSGGRSVKRAGGKKNSDGESAAATAEDEVSELYHGHHMADAWSWIQD